MPLDPRDMAALIEALKWMPAGECKDVIRYAQVRAERYKLARPPLELIVGGNRRSS
jgi:hypothetical protein